MKELISYYPNVFSKDKSDISLENYIGFVKYGSEQDIVLKARVLKQKGDIEGYKKIKSTAKIITGSAVMNEGNKTEKNIKYLNGYIVIDIDCEVSDELVSDLKNDKLTAILHRSFGGDGLCIFVKINKDKFRDSFKGLASYYFDNYNITIDHACSNPNRLRYVSFDPDIFVNEKSAKFIPKDVKRFAEPKNTNFVYTKSDFDNILDQIKIKQIDLCQEDYHRYIRIGLALFDKFGYDGKQYFHFICSFGGKYDFDRTERDWKGLSKNANGECKIGTLYYYCKDASIDIYSEKTKTIINRVKISKNQGNPTIESVSKNLLTVNDIVVTEEDKELIKELIDSKIDFSKEANSELTEIEQIENFIIDTYQPTLDVISNKKKIHDGREITDDIFNDIYLTAKKNFDFNVPINDIRSILNSSAVLKINNLEIFLRENKSNPTGIIEQYAKCVYPQCEYNVWAFTRWIVGAVHNWTANWNEKLICPLTLVLTGQQHGTGKTSFFRNILPAELEDYFIQEKINSKDKDSMFRLCSSLIIYDDEFGGEGFRDVKAFKAVSDINIITQRRPYSQADITLKRRAILCGTSNEIDVLKDVTGNRRILPINVEKIDYDRMIAIDKTSLIVEAYNLLQSGFEWILRKQDDIDYLRINSNKNEMVLPIEEIFFKHFSLEKTSEFWNERVLNQGEILEFLNANSIMRPTKYELKEVFTKNKMEYKSFRINGIVKNGVKLYMKQSDPNENQHFV